MKKKKKKNTGSADEKQKNTRNFLNLIVIVIFIISSIGYTVFMFDRIDSQYDIRLKETADGLARRVNEQINSSVNYIEGMAECFSNYEDIHCEEALDTLVRVDRKNFFTRMWLTKRDGRAISSEGKESDATGRGYLKSALKGESGISEVQYSRVNGEKNVVVYAPTYYNGEITGMVIGILRLDNLLNIIDAKSFNGEGRCIIYTDEGDVIAQSDNWEKPDSRQSRYGYAARTGIMDWNVYVSFPDSVITGEIKANIVITGVMCVIGAAVLGIILYNILHVRGLEFRRRAQQDSLTQLMNRGTIETVMETQLHRMNPLESAFIIFDVDKFKQVNDTVGHSLGDCLLKEIAGRMEKDFKDAECLGRLGGDEFGVFVQGVKDREKLLQKLELFRREVGEITIKEGESSTVSIGVAFSDRRGDTFDSLYQKADRAMYESKRLGGNRVTVYRGERETERD